MKNTLRKKALILLIILHIVILNSTYRQILECIYFWQIIIELLTNKIEYSIYIYGAPERAVFPKIYSEFI